MSTRYRLIGLTGTNGSGKGTAASFFVRRGYAYFSLSDLLREELEKAGKAATRNNLIQMGNSLRARFGADVLARRVLDRVTGPAVIDSIRNPGEVDTLRAQEGFILLAIDAPAEVRYQRVKSRGREESAATLEEFIHKEAEEMTTSERSQQIQTCMAMADTTIINDGTTQDLHQKLESIYESSKNL